MCFFPIVHWKLTIPSRTKQKNIQKIREDISTSLQAFKPFPRLLMQQPYLQFWFRKRINFGSKKAHFPSTAETKLRKSPSLVHSRAPGSKNGLRSSDWRVRGVGFRMRSYLRLQHVCRRGVGWRCGRWLNSSGSHVGEELLGDLS